MGALFLPSVVVVCVLIVVHQASAAFNVVCRQALRIIDYPVGTAGLIFRVVLSLLLAYGFVAGALVVSFRIDSALVTIGWLIWLVRECWWIHGYWVMNRFLLAIYNGLQQGIALADIPFVSPRGRLFGESIRLRARLWDMHYPPMSPDALLDRVHRMVADADLPATSDAHERTGAGGGVEGETRP